MLDFAPSRPLRFPIRERFWQGEPKVITWTGGTFPPSSFVMSPRCSMSGKCLLVMETGAFSISLVHTGHMPQREAARGNTPIPSKRLPSLMSAAILPQPFHGQDSVKGGGGDPQPPGHRDVILHVLVHVPAAD